MPEKESKQQSYTFLEVFQGSLVERAKSLKDSRFKEKEVFNKDGSLRGVVIVRPVSGLEQFLLKSVSYEVKELQDGTEIQRLKVTLQDATDSSVIYQIQFIFPGVLSSSFMKILPNIKFGEPIDLTVFPDKETKQPVLHIKNDQGQTVKSYFLKDNPNGMPEAKQSKVTGKWNFSEQTDFLLQNTLEIAGELKKFWSENAQMFETASSPSSPTKHRVLADDEALENEDADPAPKAKINILTPKEQLATFKEGGKEDDLPF